MATATTLAKRPPRNNHAVALVNRRRGSRVWNRDWTPTMRREYASYQSRCGHAKRRGLPKPEPPWFIQVQSALKSIPLAERCKRLVEAGQDALGASLALKELLSHRPGPISDLAIIHARVMAGAVADLLALAGIDAARATAPAAPARERVILAG